MHLKLLSAASAAILLSLFYIGCASAAGGCGPGFHRGRMEDVSLTEDRSWLHLWLRLWWRRQWWCRHRWFAVLAFAGIRV